MASPRDTDDILEPDIDLEIDFDDPASDLAALEGTREEILWLTKYGREFRDRHPLECEVEIEVPPAVAEYVRTIVSDAGEYRKDLLRDELLGFEARTTRYVFPDGTVVETTPQEVVVTPPDDE